MKKCVNCKSDITEKQDVCLKCGKIQKSFIVKQSIITLVYGIIFFIAGFILLVLLDDIYDYISENTSKNSVSKKSIKCDALVPSEIMYINDYYFVLKNGYLYFYDAKNEYSNKQNCIKKELDYKIKKIDREYIIDTNDNKYEIYSLSYDNFAVAKVNYSEYYLGENISKYKHIASDGDKHTFIILKDDGNVYNSVYLYAYKEGKWYYEFVSEEVLFSKKDYGFIKNFEIYDNKVSRFSTTETVYERTSSKNDKCRKYSDVECNYFYKEVEGLSKYKKNIAYIDIYFGVLKNGSIIIINGDNY